MTAWIAGLLAGWAVLRLSGVDRRWPWRIGGLAPPTTSRNRRAPRHRAAGASRNDRRRRSDGRSLRSGISGFGGTVRRRRSAPPADLVTVIDLLHVAVSAGHTLHTALSAVGRTGNGPVAAALARAEGSFERGRGTAEALAELPAQLGPAVRPLVTTLLASLRSGAPLAPALLRLADAERRRERRRAEERVRRLPVVLLAPLVGLVLPAFVVLTIVPVGWTTARAGLVPVSA